MNYKKLLMGIFLVFIIIMSSNMVFAEDISQNIDSQDNTLAIIENDIISTDNKCWF